MLKDLFAEIWKELKCGTTEDAHPFKACSLASSIADGQVKQRMVILREVTDEKTLLFYTDNRSSKIGQLEQNPVASVLFYNFKSQLQLSIKGKVIIHSSDELWHEHRLKIEGRSINDYNTKSSPGKKIKNPLNVKRTEEIHFAVLELIPDTIEYLKLRAEPNRLRAIFTKKNSEWEQTYLVP